MSLRGNRAWVFDEHARITDDQIAEDRAELNLQIRPLVVIDPDDIEQVERLCDALYGAHHGGGVVARVRNALRKFADPTPAEPTDPSARVTDRRDNIWRLLADGDWVCTSGPDVGEYIAWPRLAAERGPLAVGTDW